MLVSLLTVNEDILLTVDPIAPFPPSHAKVLDTNRGLM